MRDNWWAAFVFGFGLDQIREGYRAAIDGCDTRAQNARRDYDAFLESHGAFDEDSPEADKLMELSHSEWLANNAKTAIREAFVLSAFHYWERRMRIWTNYHEHGFDDLKRNCRLAGYPADNSMKIVNTFCNLIKHESAEHARNLAKQWSDLFEELPHGPKDKTEWVLAIKDSHVEKVFDIVARSGPPTSSE